MSLDKDVEELSGLFGILAHHNRDAVKSRQTGEQQRRRSVRLQAQKDARKLATQRVREMQEHTQREETRSNGLMLPEPLEEVPPDLATHWLCVPLPAGRRCLLIASGGLTRARLRNGHTVESFHSYLPGGGARKAKNREYCLLDCIQHLPTLSYYVLDMMCWRGHLFYDCEAEFRFFWITSKFSEEEDLAKRDDNNPYAILPLTHYQCDSQSLSLALASPQPFQVEGFYFYHKEASYTPSETPLMCHVPAHMISTLFPQLTSH